MVGSDLGCVSDNVEVWHARLDHDDISTLVNVPPLQWGLRHVNRKVAEWAHNSSTSKTFRSGWKLVTLPIAKGRGTPSGFAVITHQTFNSNEGGGTYRNGPYKLLANFAE